MKYVFDYQGSLHLYHYEDEEMENRIIEKWKQEAWRKDLKQGDWIDAIKGEIKAKCWSRAEIESIDEDQIEDKLNLKFENESSSYDKLVGKYSAEIAPLNTYAQENDWRLELKEGDEIDAFDKAK